MKDYTFLNLAEEVLNNSKYPLNTDEIWKIAERTGLINKVKSKGKTPVKTLAARLYMDIRDNEESKFIQVKKRPALFYIKNKEVYNNIDDNIDDNTQNIKFNERDLHKLLSSFVYVEEHFKCFTKTIFHEKSKKSKKGYNKWLHPDIVGVYFPFKDYDETTLNMKRKFNENTYKLYSFELKIDLTFNNLREYYFQAVSNSSWANEGYLVTLNLEKNSDFLDELRRLNNTFGIGIIKLNPENISQSEIVLASKENENLDWNTIDRLITENIDFKEFINNILEDIEIKRVKSKYDDFFKEDEDVYKYCKEKNII